MSIAPKCVCSFIPYCNGKGQKCPYKNATINPEPIDSPIPNLSLKERAEAYAQTVAKDRYICTVSTITKNAVADYVAGASSIDTQKIAGETTYTRSQMEKMYSYGWNTGLDKNEYDFKKALSSLK